MTSQKVIQQAVEPGADRKEIDLGNLLAIILANKILILSVGAIMAIIGICYSLLATPIYQADALIQIEKGSNGNSLFDTELPLPLKLNQSSLSDTQSEILNSRMIIGQAADRAGLDILVEPVYLPLLGKVLVRYGVTRPGFYENSPNVWAGESITVAELSVFEDSKLEDVGSISFIVRVLDADSFELKDSEGRVLGRGEVEELFTNKAPHLELRVSHISASPNAEFKVIKRSYEEASRHLRSGFSINKRGKDTGILSLSMKGEDRNEIARSLNAIAQVYLAQNIDRQTEEIEGRLSFLQQQAPLIHESLISAENSLNAYRITQDSVDLSLETENVLTALVAIEAQLNELDLQETDLSKRFTARHPKYQVFLEQKNYLGKERIRLESLVGDLPETQQEVLRLNRDVEVGQKIYMNILGSIQELKIAKAGTIGSVRILDNALTGRNQLSPAKRAIVASYFLAGILLGLGIVICRLMLNRGVTKVEEIAGLGLPVYATIPSSDFQIKFLNQHKKANNLGKDTICRVLAHTQPADLAVEALRSLRTSLYFTILGAEKNCLMLTSARPQSGKSFISSNLALVCAQAGQKVVLIDGDLRKGTIHHGFGGDADGGFSNLLTGKLGLDTAIRNSGQANFDYIARGNAPLNPSELLMGKQFSENLSEIRARYDLVIIDTPPVLAVTDASIIGKQVDATLLISRFEYDSTGEIERVKDQLEMAGVEIKGAILNAVKHGPRSYSNYNYNYSYISD